MSSRLPSKSPSRLRLRSWGSLLERHDPRGNVVGVVVADVAKRGHRSCSISNRRGEFAHARALFVGGGVAEITGRSVETLCRRAVAPALGAVTDRASVSRIQLASALFGPLPASGRADRTGSDQHHKTCPATDHGCSWIGSRI